MSISVRILCAESNDQVTIDHRDLHPLLKEDERMELLWNSKIETSHDFEDCVVFRMQLTEFVELSDQVLSASRKFTYLFMASWADWFGPPRFDTGGLSGFQIEGKWHAIDTGFEKCVLTNLESWNESVGKCTDVIDVRDKETIVVDGGGIIHIKKRLARSKSKQLVAKINKFLDRNPLAGEFRLTYI